jgi:hypothetical protein
LILDFNIFSIARSGGICFHFSLYFLYINHRMCWSWILSFFSKIKTWEEAFYHLFVYLPVIKGSVEIKFTQYEREFNCKAWKLVYYVYIFCSFIQRWRIYSLFLCWNYCRNP